YPKHAIQVAHIQPDIGDIRKFGLTIIEKLCAMLKKRQTVHKLNEITNRKSQRTFGTFASSDTHADASACKRAKFLPTLNRHY
ncbi:MAG: hypothetical protein KDE33_10930, partial [Bacteroidetes bacterium]|nr:hypothetical protein [Bacteroidota bacterium]